MNRSRVAAILTIDQGNTSVKAKVLMDSGEQLCAVSMPVPDIDTLATLVSAHSVECGAVCSVSHVDARLMETLRMMLPAGLLWLTADTPVPLAVRYATPRTLGADRVAAACGAAALYPGTSLLVADAGTALTLDLVEDAAFAGGNISAGVSMRLKALHAYTAALPEVSPSGPLPEFGTDTDTALRCGALRGAVAEIVAAFERVRRRAPHARLILTGGDAPLLLPLLPVETICHADLVSVGLISILKHNGYV